MRLVLLICVLALATATIQPAEAGYNISTDSVYRHIAVLAADSLEGRMTGEAGEWKAGRYIISVFAEAGLEPQGDNGGWLQAFEFTKRIDFGPENRLALNGHPLEIETDYRPMHQSAGMAFEFDQIVNVGYGIITDDSSHNDYAGPDVEGRAVLIKRYAPQTANDTTSSDTIFHRHSTLTAKILTALDKGATGIFFYTPETHDDTLITLSAIHVTPKDIPIIFIRRRALEKLGLDVANPAIHSASGLTDLISVKDTAHNVVGYLPGATDSVAIVGAHYDHIGWGSQLSRYLGAEPKIHNGADDNGSGTAAMLELARYFSSRRDELRHSLLFLAFSGEEIGALGSGHYVRNWTVDKSKARLMFNMDMIGRLAEQDKGLGILGTGTCREFKEYFDGKDLGDLKATFKESGSGPSDHAAFYNDSIPCLHFFTGAHQDYHMPEDDVETIDIAGVVSVVGLVADLLEHFDDYQGSLTFQRTKDEAPSRRARGSVSLGIMPDHISELNGLGVGGVSPERPADRAGILKGDIIIGFDHHQVGDIYDYMTVLEKYRLGDSCQVKIVRGTDTLTLPLVF